MHSRVASVWISPALFVLQLLSISRLVFDMWSHIGSTRDCRVVFKMGSNLHSLASFSFVVELGSWLEYRNSVAELHVSMHWIMSGKIYYGCRENTGKQKNHPVKAICVSDKTCKIQEVDKLLGLQQDNSTRWEKVRKISQNFVELILQIQWHYKTTLRHGDHGWFSEVLKTSVTNLP